MTPAPTRTSAPSCHDARRPRAGLANLEGPAGECDELVEVVGLLHAIDNATEEVVGRLARLHVTGEVEEATGVPLELWLSVAGRRTSSDARMLQTAADVLQRLPSLQSAFAVGDVSWSQVRAVVLAARTMPSRLDDRLDGVLAEMIERCRDVEPDGLTHAVAMVLAEQDPEPPEPVAASETDFFAMQPRLDGSGGRVWGDFGAESFAVLDERLNADAPPPSGRARDRFGQRSDPERARELAITSGARRAARLIELLTAGTVAHVGGALGSSGQLPAKVILRVDLDTLLGGSLPADLVTTLLGGRMRVDAVTARRIATEAGASLRAVVVNEVGQVVGVGRKTWARQGWLDDALLAIHDVCSGPGCRMAARVAHADHAIPVRDGGPSDVINVAPLCATENQAKERDGWQARGHPDGSRTWHHPRSGMTVQTLPATWRPPRRRAPPRSPTRPAAEPPDDPDVPF